LLMCYFDERVTEEKAMAKLRGLFAAPDSRAPEKVAPVHTSPDGTLSLSVDDLRHEDAFREQIKEFAGSRPTTKPRE